MMVGMTSSVEIADRPAQGRYEIRVDGQVAGVAQYRARPGRIEFVHTEVGDRYEGQGLGGRLVAFALDDARERGLEVLPFCPFVRDYIHGHSEYVDLVPEKLRGRFEL
jgi:predicted GNAT family acetyltransferase